MNPLHRIRRLYQRLCVKVQRFERRRYLERARKFDQRLKRGLIVGKPHHTTKTLSETYMDSLK